MSLKLLTASGDILIFGEMHKHRSAFQSGVCHSEEGAEPRLNLEKGHYACVVFSKKQTIPQCTK